MNAYDLAFKMQTESPKLFDLSHEPQETLDLYGINADPTHDYGRRCLLARKLVEAGVRFTCVVAGGGPGKMQWDAHDDIEENHLRGITHMSEHMLAHLAEVDFEAASDGAVISL